MRHRVATLDELRARAGRAGISVGALLAADRRRAARISDGQARHRARIAAEAAVAQPIDVEGVVWGVAECGGGDAYGYSWSGESNVRRVSEDLGEMGFRPYCPVAKVWTIRKRRNRDVRCLAVRSLFEGYLLVGQPPGLMLTLGLHNKISAILPGAVDPEFVARVNRAELAGVWDATKGQFGKLHKGVAVHISAGPFAGFHAVVAQAERAGHVDLQVSMFGTVVPVRAPVECVEAA